MSNAVSLSEQETREMTLVECYWDIVEANAGGCGGAALLGIARQSINYEDNLLLFIKTAVESGLAIDQALEQVRYGAHLRKVSGSRPRFEAVPPPGPNVPPDPERR